MATDIVNRLREPLSMSMFRNSGDLFAEVTAQRQEAADHIEALEAALKQCQSVLAMFIHPDTIMETTFLNAYALATAAEAKARSLVDGGTDAQQ